MRSLRTSRIRIQEPEYRSQKMGARQHKSSLLFWILTSVSCILTLLSCAPKHLALPSYEGVPIESALSELRKITSIETVLSVEYAKSDGMMSGDASLRLSEDDLDLRLYYLGFLAGEIREHNGIIQSKPNLEGNKKALLVEGLKNSFLWWNIKDYRVEEREDLFVLRNSYREIVISKKTLLPVRQTVELENGDTLTITYDSPAKAEGEKTGNQEDEKKTEADTPSTTQSRTFTLSELWYPSQITIEMRRYLVKVKVKSYSADRAYPPSP
jgi:hypothetical protein